MLFFLHSIDVFILEFVNLSYHNFILDNLSLIISNMGLIYFWVIISIVLYLFGDKKGKSIAKKNDSGIGCYYYSYSINKNYCNEASTLY